MIKGLFVQRQEAKPLWKNRQAADKGIMGRNEQNISLLGHISCSIIFIQQKKLPGLQSTRHRGPTASGFCYHHSCLHSQRYYLLSQSFWPASAFSNSLPFSLQNSEYQILSQSTWTRKLMNRGLIIIRVRYYLDLQCKVSLTLSPLFTNSKINIKTSD